MPCLRQYPASFFSLRGLVWATNQRNSDTRRIIREPAPRCQSEVAPGSDTFWWGEAIDEPSPLFASAAPRPAREDTRPTEMANYVITLLLCAKGGGSSVFNHGLSAIASATAE